VRVSGGQDPGDPGVGAGGTGGEGPEAGEGVDHGADGGGGWEHPAAAASEGQAVPDAGRGRVPGLGAWDGGDGTGGAGDRAGERRGGDRRDPADDEDGGDGR